LASGASKQTLHLYNALGGRFVRTLDLVGRPAASWRRCRRRSTTAFPARGGLHDARVQHRHRGPAGSLPAGELKATGTSSPRRKNSSPSSRSSSSWGESRGPTCSPSGLPWRRAGRPFPPWRNGSHKRVTFWRSLPGGFRATRDLPEFRPGGSSIAGRTSRQPPVVACTQRPDIRSRRNCCTRHPQRWAWPPRTSTPRLRCPQHTARRRREPGPV